ncbi:DMT family transporter [Jeotgalibacillus proteolyticus]|uniref:EamA family transporter n=1 Tax=Jeotgalibacillus proteolyticus TaxID=2082395 RepID=A0A2S5GDF7_9BACL|nr:DMT family transporter [Jeotgalibacillus proteolyticus]PPA71026.1 EamA family transporter [Jeotgalibacillus proteolyticus]
MQLYSALILLSLIWGLSFVFISEMISVAGVWGTVLLRCLAGAVILLPLFITKVRKEKGTGPLPWKAIITVGIFNAGLPWGLIALSQTEITSNTAAVLNASTPILTGLMGFIFFSVLLTKRQWGGIALGFIGILILIDFNAHELLTGHFIGIGTMVLAAACYGFSSQFSRRHLQKLNVLVLTTLSLLVGASVGLVGVLFTEPSFVTNVVGSIDAIFIISLIGLGCLGSGVAHLLFYYLINKGGAEFATTVTYLVPLTALLWGKVLLGEAVTQNLLVGLVTIFLGVYLANWKPKKERQHFLSRKQA